MIKSKRGNIDTFNSELETKLVHLLCADVATCIQRQCGREFGFPAPGEDCGSRAADLTAIDDDLLVKAPTNNNITERHLSVFSRRSETAKYKMHRHTGEQLRDTMVLHLSESKQLDASAREIRKVLAMHTEQWNENQKELHQERLKMKIADTENGGLCHKVVENMQNIGWSMLFQTSVLEKNPDKVKTIVKAEMSFYAHTHKADRPTRTVQNCGN